MLFYTVKTSQPQISTMLDELLGNFKRLFVELEGIEPSSKYKPHNINELFYFKKARTL